MLGWAHPVRGQSVSGIVVAPDGATPIPGAIVVAWSSRGDTVRTLTAATGRFRIVLPHGGDYLVRLLRIGHRPTDPIAVAVRGSVDTEVVLLAAAAPVSLETVRIHQHTTCQAMPADGAVIARAWEEARKAMLATRLTSDRDPLEAEWIEFERRTDPSGRIVRSQEVRVQQAPTTRVFRGPPPDSVALHGFITEDDTGLTYVAPDPLVLLSSVFTTTHCFALRDAPQDSSRLGVAFTPARQRTGIYDISGVVWLDRTSSELRRVDFAYTGLPAVTGLEAGGSVTFARLPTGAWIVSAWQARVPLFAQRYSNTGSGILGQQMARSRITTVTSYHMSGGDVVRAQQSGATVFERATARGRVRLMASTNALLAGGAEISIDGTNVRGVTDSSGFADLGPLPVGRYAMVINFPVVDAVVPPRVERWLDVRLPTQVDSVELPPIAQLMKAVCQTTRSVTSDAGTAVLQGTLRAADGRPAVAVPLEIRFQRVDARGLRSGSVRTTEQLLTVTTDHQGHWRVCGVPHEALLTVEGSRGTDRVRWRGRVDPARLSLAIALSLSPIVPSAAETPQVLSALHVESSTVADTVRRPATSTSVHLLTSEDIAKMRVEQTWQIFSRMTGVQIRRNAGGIFAVTSRGNAPSLRFGAMPCPLQVTVNGMAMPPRSVDGVDLHELPIPRTITRIEVYASGAETPVHLASSAGGAWCGLIAITTGGRAP